MKRREFLRATSRMGAVATFCALGSGNSHGRPAVGDVGSERLRAAGPDASSNIAPSVTKKSAIDVYRAYLRRDELVSGGVAAANWTQDAGYWFAEGSSASRRTLRVDLRSGQTTPFEMPRGGIPAGQTPDSRTWKRSSYLTDRLDVPELLSPDGQWLASVANHNVMLRSTRDGGQRALTSDGTADQFWDLEPGSAWSPDSRALLAYRRDITGVFRTPRVNSLKRFEDVDFIPYQKAGARIDRIAPTVIDVRSGKQTPVDVGQVEDRYIVVTDWHRHEAIITVYSRDLKRVDVLAANSESGAVRVLLTEIAATFQVSHIGAAVSRSSRLRILPGEGGFLWLSSRDGWNHIYHYSWKGRPIAQVTSGEWPVYDIEHLGADGFVYFTGAVDKQRPYDVHVCRVRLNGSEFKQLTRDKGIHTPRFAPNGQAFLDTHSAVDRPVQTDLVRADGKALATVSRMDIARLESVGYMPAEEFTVTAADGATALWGVMYKPFDFDASKRYPVVEYIYGGPQTIAANRFFAVSEDLKAFHRHMPWALAQLGYIVVCVDARGTPGRSKAFQDFVYGNWAAGMVDHPAAIRQLCERHSWMDIDRVGVTGHSFGGYFAACALIQAPDLYRAAVASAPGPEPLDMIIWEPYLDLPQHDPSRYDRADLTRQAAKVKGHLMLAVGTSDFANINSTLRMTRALFEAGVNHELVVVPGAVHSYAEGAELDYFLMKLVDWFERHVKNRER